MATTTTSKYSKNSPYSKTPMWGNFLDVWVPKTFTFSKSDVVYQIDNFYNLRPDLLAYDLYKDAGLWWVFAVRNPNTIRDPIFDFKTGTTIYIPPLTALQSVLA
jgi:hypothetical protein